MNLARARPAVIETAGDIDPTDSAAVFAMLGMAFEMCSATHPDLWRRYLTIILDGLRATDRGLLPARALSFDEVEASMASLKH